MQHTEAQQLLLDIIEQAKKSNTPFTFITTWNEFRFCRQNFRATKLIIKTLEASKQKLFKSYCKDIADGSADVDKLLATKQLEDIIAYYKRELDVLERMLKDYDDYLGQGNFWYSFLGGERNLWNLH
jgi:hypothetical protein